MLLPLLGDLLLAGGLGRSVVRWRREEPRSMDWGTDRQTDRQTEMVTVPVSNMAT